MKTLTALDISLVVDQLVSVQATILTQTPWTIFRDCVSEKLHWIVGVTLLIAIWPSVLLTMLYVTPDIVMLANADMAIMLIPAIQQNVKQDNHWVESVSTILIVQTPMQSVRAPNIISKSQSNTVESDPLTYVIKTEVIVPDPPTGANCKEVADEFITVEWNAPAVPNGDLRQYYIHVHNSSRLVKIVGTDTVVNELKVLHLKPVTYYNFRVYTENEKYNSSLYGQSPSCPTKAKISEAPQDLAITGVTSRAFTVSWERPNNTYSEEFLGYVLQIKEGDSCSAPTSSKVCIRGDRMDESKSNAELQNSTLTLSNNTFKPDTDYTVLVAAVNDIGWGHQAVQSVKSKEEGYDNTSRFADGLEEYWNYTVSVTARTNVGGAKTSYTTQKYRTLPSAPGNVTEFGPVKAHLRSDNFHKMTIQWKAPLLLQRNSVIKEYVLKYNVGNTTASSGVGGRFKTISFTSETGDGFYSKVFDVIPESSYQFEVIKEGSKDQTYISLNLVREFFTEETNGRVQRTALLGCKSSACPESFI
ncbi:TITIN-like protein, partial [Mya arenaria]